MINHRVLFLVLIVVSFVFACNNLEDVGRVTYKGPPCTNQCQAVIDDGIDVDIDADADADVGADLPDDVLVVDTDDIGLPEDVDTDVDVVENDTDTFADADDVLMADTDTDEVDTSEDVAQCDCDASEDVAVDSDVDLPDSEGDADVAAGDVDAEADTGFECDENNPCSGDFICDLVNHVCGPACQIQEEICDGEDNNCNGEVDEGLPTQLFYRDADGDGFGDASDSLESCLQAIDGRVLNTDDCNDQSDQAHPGGHEAEIDTSGADPVFIDRCHDSFDNDCDGQTDVLDDDCQDRDGDTVVNGVDPIFTVDQDNDGTNESICVVADLVFPSPWNTFGAVLQGSTPTWGAYTSLFVPERDRLRTPLLDGAYCYNPSNEGSAVAKKFRWISQLNVAQTELPEQDVCETWKIFSIQDYCAVFSVQDIYCYAEMANGSPCDSGTPGWVIGVSWINGRLSAF